LLLLLFFTAGAGPLFAGGNTEEGPERKEREFVVNLGGESAVLDPHLAATRGEYHIAGALFEGLFRFDGRTGKGKPGLALDWTTDEAGTTYTFTLRETAWSDGEPITAGTVARSWARVLDPELGSPHAWLLSGLIDNEGVRVIDTHRLQIQLKAPVPYLEDILWHPAFAVVPMHVIERYGDQWSDLEHIACNGPYLPEYENGGDRLVLRVNNTYWDYKSTGFEKVVLLFENDPEAAYRLFVQGKVDWNRVAAPEAFEEMRTEEIREMEAFHQSVLCGTGFLLCNLDRKPLNNRERRRFISDVLSPGEIENLIARADTELTVITPASTLLPPGLLDGGATARRGIPEEEPDGPSGPVPSFQGALSLLLFEDPLWSKLASGIARLWRSKTGGEITVEEVDWETYVKRLREGAFDLAVYSHTAEVLDPAVFLERFRTGSALNFSGFTDSDFDRLLEEAENTQPGFKRNELLARAEEVLLEEGAVIPLFHYTVYNMIDLEKWKGWHENMLDIHPFSAISLPGPSAAR
jgi:oligopeptide transport system substrate-binding protein